MLNKIKSRITASFLASAIMLMTITVSLSAETDEELVLEIGKVQFEDLVQDYNSGGAGITDPLTLVSSGNGTRSFDENRGLKISNRNNFYDAVDVVVNSLPSGTYKMTAEFSSDSNSVFTFSNASEPWGDIARSNSATLTSLSCTFSVNDNGKAVTHYLNGTKSEQERIRLQTIIGLDDFYIKSIKIYRTGDYADDAFNENDYGKLRAFFEQNENNTAIIEGLGWNLEKPSSWYDNSGEHKIDWFFDGSEMRVGGIELTGLGLSGEFDISDFIGLGWCDISGNQISEIDLSNCINLGGLSCGENLLTSLDLSDNAKISGLWCSNNNLTSLDLSSLTELTDLVCNGNQIENLDIQNCTKLLIMHIYNNKLTALDVSNNINLKNLSCHNNDFDVLDVTKNTKLESLRFGDTKVASIDVSNNILLKDIAFWGLGMSQGDIDLSNNTELCAINAPRNNFTSIASLENLPNLFFVDIRSNNLNLNNTAVQNSLIALKATIDGNIGSAPVDYPYDNTLSPYDLYFDPQNMYTVTFLDYNGTELNIQSLYYGTSATAPANPSRTGYTFSGWDKSFNSITSSITVTAQYIQNYNPNNNDNNSNQDNSENNDTSAEDNDTSGEISETLIDDALKNEKPYIKLDENTGSIIDENSLFKIKESGKPVEIELESGLVVTIDPNSITDAARAIDLNIDIIYVANNNKDNNEAYKDLGVHVGANSIIIAPSAHGEFGFEISFKITKAQLKANGINGNNIALYYIDDSGNVSPDGKLKLANDGSVTVTISHASSYVLSDEMPVKVKADERGEAVETDLDENSDENIGISEKAATENNTIGEIPKTSATIPLTAFAVSAAAIYAFRRRKVK